LIQSKQIKISEAHKGKRGQHHTQEAKDKISKASKGRIHTQEMKDNQSKRQMGRTHTQEAKDKISQLDHIIIKESFIRGINGLKNKFNLPIQNNITSELSHDRDISLDFIYGIVGKNIKDVLTKIEQDYEIYNHALKLTF